MAFAPASSWPSDRPGSVRQAAGAYLERLQLQDVYRDPERLGGGKKSFLMTLTLRSQDATLTGEVSSISITPASFAPNQLASRYVITMSARMGLRDNHSNTVLWQNPSLVFRQDYEAASGSGPLDPTAFFGQQANALDRVSTEFARTIVSAILEAF